MEIRKIDIGHIKIMPPKTKKTNNVAIFLDRDGTLIYDVGYPKHPEQVKMKPGAIQTLKKLKDYGYKLVIVTNQSGIGRGILTVEDVEKVNKRLLAILARHGIKIDAIYYCPHAPEDNCSCRKPSPNMLLMASMDLNINLSSSYIIGDKRSDMEAGFNAGCKKIFLGIESSDIKDLEIDYMADDWYNIMEYFSRING